MLPFLIESIAACAVFTLLGYIQESGEIRVQLSVGHHRAVQGPRPVDDSNRRWGPGFIIVKLGALVLDCIWFCHGKRFIIPGTEDMKEAYHDYRFHIKGALIGMLLLVPLALIAGLVTVCL